MRSMLKDMGGVLDDQCLPLHENPWASLVPQRTVDHHGAANFNNQYIFAVRPPIKVQQAFGAGGSWDWGSDGGGGFRKKQRTAQ